VYTDLHAWASGRGFEGTTSGIPYLPDGDARMAEGQLAMLDLEVVLVSLNVLVSADFGLRYAIVFDFHLKVERRDTFERDRDHFLAIALGLAITVGLTWIIEPSAGTRIYRLEDSDR
jgi:hypothetical protein